MPNYKYILGNSPAEFLDKLNIAGKDGYKLLQTTKIPLRDFEESYELMAFAGILKYDGEQTFDYQMVVAYNTFGVEAEMNEWAKKGYRYLKTYGFAEGKKTAPGCDAAIDDAIGQMMCRSSAMNLWRMGSIVLMDRASGKQKTVAYRVVTGGTKQFIWERSTSKILKDVFTAAVTDAFPVGVFIYQPELLSEGVILEVADDNEQAADGEKLEYVLVKYESGGRFRRDVKQFAKSGFRIIVKSGEFAVMLKRSPNPTPVTYFSADGKEKDDFLTILGAKKNLTAELNRLANQGATFRVTDADGTGSDSYDGKLLFERKLEDDGKRFEYQVVTMTEVPTYKYVKLEKGGRRDRVPQSESAEAMKLFEQRLKEGYTPRAMFYGRGINVLFERQIKP